ncbi:MAG TPA: hydrolase TatD [Candidatus Magasanikbacteria bacterium]|nr:hydrolase TatD [Candidatus Magasanikbacteria bacterium]
MSTLIDTHCHIQFQGYKDDRNEVISRCIKKNVIMNAVGTQMDTSKKAMELAEQYDNIYATIGLHPIHLHATEVDEEESNFISRDEDFDETYYDELAKSKKVIGVGECGLELYHVPEGQNSDKILDKQKDILGKQIKFAKKHNLPVVFHCRDAYNELLEYLKLVTSDQGSPITGVVHCYSSNWENAQQFIDLGLYLGFTGVLTFPARKTNPQPTIDLLEVAKNIPLDRFLIETDAPYLSPQAYRGKRCEPWMVEEVAKKMAEIKQKSVEEIMELSVNNAKNLFTNIK